MLSNYRIIKVFLFIISVILVYMTVNLRWGGDEKWMRIVQADGRGYYGHLPAIFIYDLSFSFSDSIENKKLFPPYGYVRYGDNGKPYNKYYGGVALMETPFFLMGHLTSWLADKPMDGYSKLYFKFFNLGAIFYAVLGFWFLSRFLMFFTTNQWHVVLTIIFILFGTNMLYYAVYESSLSHIFSFSLFSAFIYYSHLFFYRFRKRYIVFLGALLGLIVIVRPINGIVLLSLPLIARRYEVLLLGWEKIRRNPKALSLGVLAGAFFVFLQLLEYKLGTGKWFVYSYNGESFWNWTGAHIIPFLFSYHKGLFLYTPMYLIIIVLAAFYFRKNMFQYVSWMAFILLVIYALSAWFQWWYGGSFSSRVMVEFLPFFALPLVFILKSETRAIPKYSILIVFACLTLVCLLQTAQYHYGLIHYNDMDKEWYWRVFLKIP